ncbi:MAG: hypothetical protein FJ280_29540, partial [Planctomycetes bacterium]|nr:hypothetical protein [Planctomycetota bacterium]
MRRRRGASRSSWIQAPVRSRIPSPLRIAMATFTCCTPGSDSASGILQWIWQRANQRRSTPMRTPIIPDSDFRQRVTRLQAEMARADMDVLVTYSSESEPASSRYLADFWPFFDFAAVVVPREGEPVLVTGGPESFEFARQFSRIVNLHIHPGLVESSAPDWVPPVVHENFASII